MNDPSILEILLTALLVMLGSITYVALGFIIGATLCKRRNASWRWINSNIGEFVMMMGIIPLIVYAFFWPFQIALGFVSLLFHYIAKKTERYNTTNWHPVTSKMDKEFQNFDPDFEFNSMYPGVMKVHKKKD